MKTFSTVNETCPDMMASCSFPENTKNNDLYLVRRRDLAKNKSHHISQLFGYKFQSKMQYAFQSKHSHSTPGISIYFHSVSNARMKGLSGSVKDGRSATAATARRMSLSFTSEDGDDLCPMAGSESAHSCRSVYPVFGSMYFRFHTAL